MLRQDRLAATRSAARGGARGERAPLRVAAQGALPDLLPYPGRLGAVFSFPLDDGPAYTRRRRLSALVAEVNMSLRRPHRLRFLRLAATLLLFSSAAGQAPNKPSPVPSAAVLE